MSDTPASRPTPRRNPEWSKTLFAVVFILVVIAAIVALFWQRQIGDAWSRMFGTERVQTGTTHIEQYDYGFHPRHITWRVGDKVTISLHNASATHWHEMMIGRGFDDTPYVVGPVHTQFDQDFWDGVHVTMSHAFKVDNFVPNKAIVTFVGQKPFTTEGGNFSPTLEPGGSLDLTFTVPNKPGTWQYGCFVQQFMHYVAGMHGTITILPAKT
ncbi:hypothetical protein [Alicyclobacillus ferrooxydans]|uniref:EfeO-type cupredoxin-like domain-containing protein n=1 Tax=Alicyclobacillus ferrooxydans TaxID=471514 RepID=A0A0P9C9U2_9BACL|nr:hypothetical protein [Alicyclobacillus ferrooxydans]KPV41967.1 hypothetical protein AN477_19515 [Alicyclobacillus ferrooxydans]